jgi:hypothetical protein
MHGPSRAAWVVGITLLLVLTAFGVGGLPTFSSHGPPSAHSFSLPIPTLSGANSATPTPAPAPHPQLENSFPEPRVSTSSIRVVGPDLPAGEYPSVWGVDHVPPGAPTPSLPWGGPPTVGYDHPALDPYSDLPGSGGNVTWNVTLPVDRSATMNQTDLYPTVWFGVDLTDPYGYDGQCLLELQFYPDTNGNYQLESGVWSAYAVGWQINLANGAEDTCFTAPVTSGHTAAPFQMVEGDTVTVRMSGWIGSPFGENITVTDTSSGVSGFLTAFNTTGNYPLDPAYLANNLDDALLWSTGGNLPVSFAFDTGWSANEPAHNAYGGCSPGGPTPSPLDPATPCGSYNPQSWANDTLQPWQFNTVRFFNHVTTQTATQLGFEQNFGGISWINPESMGSCLGRVGSAYCSYPWYSYSRTDGAIEFGATDYLSTVYDFGKYLQYDSTLSTSTAGLGYFPARNYTVPTAGTGDTLTITIDNLGTGTPTVYFLNYTLTATTTIDNLASGSYSINSVPGAGEAFDDYATSGSATMDADDTPWSSVRLAGVTDGITVTFELSGVAMTVGLHVNVPGGKGYVAIGSGFDLSVIATYSGLDTAQYTPVTWTNETNGATDTLDAGMYSLQALPLPGYNFTGWSVTGNAYLFDVHSNYTWLNVSTTGAAPMLTANFAATTGSGTVFLESVPAIGGTISFDGKTYDSGSSATVPDGTYKFTAAANASYTFETWSYSGDASMSDFPSPTEIVLQGGVSWVVALFHSAPAVTLATAGTGSGAVAFNGALQTGTVALSQVEATSYPLVAAAHAGSAFAGWTVSSHAALWVANPAAPVTSILVNATGTLTATFTAAPEVTVNFDPSGPGSITWNFNQIYSSPFANGTITPGVFVIAPTPNALSSFTGWVTAGGVSLSTLYSLNALGEWVTQYELIVTGAGTVTADFSGETVPVTFVDFPSSIGTIAKFTSASPPFSIDAGATGSVAPGSYTVSIMPGVTGVRWTATSNLTLSGASGTTVTVAVGGSGTLYALAVSAPSISITTVSPSIVESDVPFTVTATISGGTFPYSVDISLGQPLAGAYAYSCAPGQSTLVTTKAASVCTLSVTLPGSYTETVWANVTDVLKNFNSSSAAVQLLWPPTLTFTSPASSSQLSSTSNLSLAVGWTNTVPTAALPGLEETLGLIDQSTGAYVTDTPTPTHTGLASLWIPAASTNSATLGPADLLDGPHVAPGSYWVAVSFWSTAVLNSDGYPTLFLTTVEEPLTVADVQLLAPASGSSAAAGDVTLAYALNGPGISSAQLTVKNGSGLVATKDLPLQPSNGTGSVVLSLAAGSYTAILSTYNEVANAWLNSSSTFTITPLVSTPPPPPVYHNTTSVPGYVDYVYTGLLVLGTLIGLLVMWALTRRRREPPSPMAPLTPTPVPPAVAPGVPQGIPPGPAEWDETAPPRGGGR